jgi:hypothetical protein
MASSPHVALPSLIPAERLAAVLHGLGVADSEAEVASRLPPAFVSVVSGAVRLACVLNDGAWSASSDLNDEEQCDTVAVLARWRDVRTEASSALDALLGASCDPHGALFPRRTDTETAFRALGDVLDAAVTRRIARRRQFDEMRKQRLDLLGKSVKSASSVASAVGLGATVISFCAGASFLPGLLLARSAVAVAGASYITKITGAVPTLAQVSCPVFP